MGQIKCSLPSRGANAPQEGATVPASPLEALERPHRPRAEGCYWLGLAFLQKALSTQVPAAAVVLQEHGVRPASGR